MDVPLEVPEVATLGLIFNLLVSGPGLVLSYLMPKGELLRPLLAVLFVGELAALAVVAVVLRRKERIEPSWWPTSSDLLIRLRHP